MSLEELRKKKLEELQVQQQTELQEQLEEQAKLAEQVSQLESIAKQHMSKEAISRYGNLKLAHPELALQVAALIAQAAQLGQLNETVSDTQFKELLSKLQQGKKNFKLKK